LNHEEIRDGRVLYLQDWPEEVLPVVRAAMQEAAFLIPAWCHDVVVTWHSAVGDRGADIEADVSYRRARLRICPQFIDQTAEERVSELRHELIHISTSPIVDYAMSAIRRLVPRDEREDALFKTLRDGLKERHEGCVQDLTRCIAGLNRK
jgi:hypothetical protein